MKIILLLAIVLGVFGLISYSVTVPKIEVEAVTVAEETRPLNIEAEERQVRSKNKPLVLVELFTSEGCSSCPPADKNLIYFNDKQPFEEAEVIALSLHVDYWNRLGWQDPFSSAQFSERQSYYSDTFNLNGVYTPQMVVDGQLQFVGSNFQEAQKAIKTAVKMQKANLTLSLKENKISVEISDIPKSLESNVYLAIAEDNLSINVRNGENGGRTLQHSAVVRELKTIGTLKPTDDNFKTETAFHFNPEWKKKEVKLVVFIQNKQTGQIIGVNQIRL